MAQKSNIVVYPVVFTPEEVGYSVRVPDVPEAITQGDTLEEAVSMAQNAVGLALEGYNEYPDASKTENIELEEWENEALVSLVAFNIEDYRKKNSKTVRRNISIPEYLNEAAKRKHINVSKVTTEALEELILG
ncbi:type II toxin-antitoxin system HicB family antitoxin [Pseudolactococcus yaeyamensis]